MTSEGNPFVGHSRADASPVGIVNMIRGAEELPRDIVIGSDAAPRDGPVFLLATTDGTLPAR